MENIVVKSLVTLLFGLLAGNEFCIAFFIHPILYSLNTEVHAPTAKKIAKTLGTAMPFFYAITLFLNITATVLAFIKGVNIFFWLTASILLAGSIIFTVLGLLPINNQISEWDLQSLPSNWLENRRKWDRLHLIRVIILLLAFLSTILGLAHS